MAMAGQDSLPTPLLLVLLLLLLLLLLLIPLQDALLGAHEKPMKEVGMWRLELQVGSTPLLCLGFRLCNHCGTFGGRQQNTSSSPLGWCSCIRLSMTYEHIHLRHVTRRCIWTFMQGLLAKPFASPVTHKLMYPYGHVMCIFWPTMSVVHFDAHNPQNKQHCLALPFVG